MKCGYHTVGVIIHDTVKVVTTPNLMSLNTPQCHILHHILRCTDHKSHNKIDKKQGLKSSETNRLL